MSPLAAVAIVVASATFFGTCSDVSFDSAVKPFLAAHCNDCHGPDLQKAKLRLDTLAPKFDDKDSAQVWIKALDKITSGQMPPASEPRPAPNDISATAAFLTKQLNSASLTHQQREGRVPIRRLNKLEYENTLSDLLGTPIDVKSMLPDDNIVAGFDNVSEGLDLSAFHFVRYQEAADAALATAMPYRLKVSAKERKTGADLAKGNEQITKNLDTRTRIQGNTLTFFSRMHYAHVASPHATVTGRYTIRVSAYAVGSGGKSLPLGFFYSREAGSHANEFGDIRDVPADKASVIEWTVELNARGYVIFDGMSLPDESDVKYSQKDPPPPDFKDVPGIAYEWIEIEGPLDKEIPASYHRLFGDLPLKARSIADAEAAKKSYIPKLKESRNDWEWSHDPLIPVSTDPRKGAEKLLRDFLPRAARRPVAQETIDEFVKFANDRLDKKYTFNEAMIATYKAILCSPHFLIYNEQPGKLDDYAIASRLSYFLWRTMPDTELLDLAAKGTLSKREVLDAQIERLLNSPRAQAFVEDFTGQWLDLRRINATSPDPKMYAEFDPYLLWSMPRETQLFFDEILRKDLSITNFVSSDWTMANDRLAKHYGIAGVEGNALKKVALPATLHRGGVLTQASVLKVTADGTRTSPILRGKWVLDRIIGKPPSPPPPDVPTIEPDIRGATSVRALLNKHRNTAACAACHKYIDPPGFALETFDVIGGWRDYYRSTQGWSKTQVALANYPERKCWKGAAVEKGDTTPEGRVFKDIDDYKTILLDDKDQIARNIIRKLMTFATGEQIQFADREVVETILNDARKKDFGLRTIIHDIVQSRVFLNK